MNIYTKLFGLLISALLAGCGGGGSDGPTGSEPPPLSPPPPPPSGGIGRTGFAYGPVSNFGSVVVNGVHYETNNAAFTINGIVGVQDDLSVGDIVLIVGTINDDGVTGTADEVIFDDSVTGPVQSIDLVLNQLVVLGQTVLVRPDTSFDDSFSPASLSGASIGQIVEVSGQFDANGDILATRIEPKPAGTDYEVHGTVSDLDGASSTFALSGLTVDYGTAVLDNFPGGTISDGDFVEAKGLGLGGGGELIATSVELKGLFPAAVDGDRVEIEGFITRFASAQDFDVAGFPVTTDGSTVFEGGDANDLGPNIKVEVEGDIDGNGILVGGEVDIRRAKAVRATAFVDSVNAASDSLLILGFPVVVDALTRMEDKSDAKLEPLTLNDINAGDYIHVRGSEFPAGSGTILATIFEREDPDAETILQGFVESVSNPSLTILGVTIETSGGTVFRDENDVIISSVEFFNRVQPGSLIKADGSESSATPITAIEVGFELEL
jgi:hypothetical protein